MIEDGTFRRIDGKWKFFPGEFQNAIPEKEPKKRGEMTAAEIAKWWTPAGDEPERRAAILSVTSNEDTWDAYTLPIEDPFFDRWRGISKKSLLKISEQFFKKHFLEED